MFQIDSYISKLIDLLKINFDERLIYVGLQGSYLRGEATENSDIDIMVILDELTVSDLKSYRSVIQCLGDFEKSCGFICSKSDLANWNPLEICHVLNSTKDYYGALCDYIPSYTETDICNFIKVSVNNLYHEICHRYIHADENKSAARLHGSYKSVFFILQNLMYLKFGKFAATKAELLACLTGDDFAVLKRSMDYERGISYDYQESFELLFRWCQKTLTSLS